MAISIQTNVNSLIAQENLRANSAFQNQTIQRLTSGYRINSSSDDAAGLAIANKFRSDTAELSQGVRNANDAVSQLQIIDGGLTDVSKMLDRLKTLATQSASNAFTGDRDTLNNEYSTLLGEIGRQASNIGLGVVTTFNKDMKVYIGGGGGAGSILQTNATVEFDLSGANGNVGIAALGIQGTTINGDVQSQVAGTVNLNTSAKFLVGGSETYSFTIGAKTATATVAGGTDGITSTQAIQSLNSQLAPYGVRAGTDSSGHLQFTSGSAFTLGDVTAVVDGLIATSAGSVTEGASAIVGGATDTTNALDAVVKIATAVQNLGKVQGKVGTAQNQLNYAISLAQSQITNFSAANAAIRDADVAAEAANLTKAQVLQQASMAAMAQANSAPQAVLALLR